MNTAGGRPSAPIALAPSTFRVINGGVATELSRQGLDLSDGLWSARVLVEAPGAIERVHTEYFLAGADIAITASYQASYQASYEGFAKRGLSAKRTNVLLQRSVQRARSARSRVLRDQPGTVRELLVAAGADLLACETIPSRIEAAALVRLLGERPDANAWVTFSCRDGRHTSSGDSIADCARWIGGCCRTTPDDIRSVRADVDAYGA